MKRIIISLLILFLPVAPSAIIAGTIPQPTIQRIMFIGNSLTLSEPFPGIGWYHAWGMAASQADRDYVHRVQLGVTARQGSIVEISIARADIPFPDDDIASKIQAFQPDIIVTQMGDNAPFDIPFDVWRKQYQEIAQADDARLIVVGLWGKTPGDVREGYIEALAAEFGARFVPIGDLYSGATIADSAVFFDAGVRWHPGDTGMQMIADRLLAAIYGDVVYVPMVVR